MVNSFKRLIDKLQNGSVERSLFLNELNILFRTLYTSDCMNFPCKASVAYGVTAFKHDTSFDISKSGLKITLEKELVTSSEIREVSQCLLSDKNIIKVLMLLGFDTLIVAGVNEKTSVLYCIRDYNLYCCYTFN